jgi:hypothetical protein
VPLPAARQTPNLEEIIEGLNNINIFDFIHIVFRLIFLKFYEVADAVLMCTSLYCFVCHIRFDENLIEAQKSLYHDVQKSKKSLCVSPQGPRPIKSKFSLAVSEVNHLSQHQYWMKTLTQPQHY